MEPFGGFKFVMFIIYKLGVSYFCYFENFKFVVVKSEFTRWTGVIYPM